MGLARRDRGVRRGRWRGASPTTRNEEIARNPMRAMGSGGVPASAALPRLDHARRHGRRRGALPLPARRSERDPCYYSDTLLDRGVSVTRLRSQAACASPLARTHLRASECFINDVTPAPTPVSAMWMFVRFPVTHVRDAPRLPG